PERDLILVLAFVVVFVTLVGQGLTLPWVARALGLANAGRQEQEERRREESQARRAAIEAAQKTLDVLANDPDVPDEVVARLRAHQQQRLTQIRLRGDDSDERH